MLLPLLSGKGSFFRNFIPDSVKYFMENTVPVWYNCFNKRFFNVVATVKIIVRKFFYAVTDNKTGHYKNAG